MGYYPLIFEKTCPLDGTIKCSGPPFLQGETRYISICIVERNQPKNYKPKANVKAPDLQLTEEQIKFFHDNGYVGPFDLLSPNEVNELREYCFDVLSKDSQVYNLSKGDYYFPGWQEAECLTRRL